MKKTILFLALVFIVAFSNAQNTDIPAGMRMEVTEVEENNNQYTIFTYKDDDGTFGYYLSLGRVYRLLEVTYDDRSSATLDHVDETCLWLGTTADEAYASLEHLLNLLDEELGTTVEMPCRQTYGLSPLTDTSTATCIVVKRFLQRKRLCFHFTVGRRTAEADLTRSAIKSLRWSFRVAQKLNLTD